MYLEMFGNELSLTPVAPDVSVGQERAKQFVMTMRAATARGVHRVLRLSEDFLNTPFAPDYDFYRWTADKRVERELQQYFRTLSTKVPFFRYQPIADTVLEGIECYRDGKLARGLTAAYIADGLAVSMCSQPVWEGSLVECEVYEIVGADVECRTDDVHHASCESHVDQQTAWFEQRIQHTVENGAELWRCSRDHFPALSWCASIEEQMVGLPSGALASITRGLFRLNAYCSCWQSGPFDPDSIGCAVSPESQSTLDTYSAERTFLCPDGRQRVFSWHAKMGQWRIYFDPEPGPGRLLLGYVGRHLRTTKFR
jgi:hypothetical protein